MSNVNRGKEFEACIRTAFESAPDTSVIRLIDPQNGFAGVRNICDFVVYNKPYQYLIECKSCHGSSLPFTNITDNQWHGLKQMSKIDGVVAGVLVWFVDKDVTYFVPIQILDALRNEGYKSIRYDRLEDVFVISATKRRVLFDYDMTSFLSQDWSRLNG